MIDAQVKGTLAAQAAGPHCGTPRRHKDTRAIVLRTRPQVGNAVTRLGL